MECFIMYSNSPNVAGQTPSSPLQVMLCPRLLQVVSQSLPSSPRTQLRTGKVGEKVGAAVGISTGDLVLSVGDGEGAAVGAAET
jgi:hypothetical protein